MSKTLLQRAWAVRLFSFVIITLILFDHAAADGTETHGPPSIAIAKGTGVIVAGVGLADPSGDINFSEPTGASVEQVLLYWEGQDRFTFTGDDNIDVNGISVTGTLIGGRCSGLTVASARRTAAHNYMVNW